MDRNAAVATMVFCLTLHAFVSNGACSCWDGLDGLEIERPAANPTNPETPHCVVCRAKTNVSHASPDQCRSWGAVKISWAICSSPLLEFSILNRPACVAPSRDLVSLDASRLVAQRE